MFSVHKWLVPALVGVLIGLGSFGLYARVALVKVMGAGSPVQVVDYRGKLFVLMPVERPASAVVPESK